MKQPHHNKQHNRTQYCSERWGINNPDNASCSDLKLSFIKNCQKCTCTLQLLQQAGSSKMALSSCFSMAPIEQRPTSTPNKTQVQNAQRLMGARSVCRTPQHETTQHTPQKQQCNTIKNNITQYETTQHYMGQSAGPIIG